MRKIRYQTGLTIPNSGIYRVIHKQHRLPHEVTLLADEKFPTCCKCEAKVEFELLMGVSDPNLMPFKVRLYELPEMDASPQKNHQQEAPEEEAC